MSKKSCTTLSCLCVVRGIKGEKMQLSFKLYIIRFIVGLAVISMFAGREVCSQEEDHYRVFSDTEGRTFKGEIIAYDARRQMVRVRRAEDGKTANKELTVFAEPDQLYIRGWAVSNDFSSGVNITAKLRSSSVASEAAGLTDVTKRVFDSVYTIGLTNATTTAFSNIDVEYCIFYRQGKRTGITINYDEGVAYGKTSVDALKPAGSASFSTKSIRLYTEGGSQTVFGSVEVSDASIRGIWLRLKIKLPSGEDLVRDFRTSHDSYWEWTTQSTGAGLNVSAEAPRYRVIYEE